MTLKIVCRLIKSTDKNSYGKYVKVSSNLNDNTFSISIDDFEEKILDTSGSSEFNDPDIEKESTRNLSSDIIPHTEFVRSITNKLGIDSYDTNVIDYVLVVSNASILLELPWEKLKFGPNMIVVRKLDRIDVKSTSVQNNNMLVLLSHARNGISDDIRKYMNIEVDEINKAVNFLKDETQSSFRIEKILISKHTSIRSLDDIDWASYSIIHMIIHGESNGDLCFETDNIFRYKTPHKLSQKNFLEKIHDFKFNLFFASSCYSAGGLLLNNDSLAYKIVEQGISNSSIGYRNPVGETFAKNFASYFYQYLTGGFDVIDVYKKSLRKVYEENLVTNYIPFLFVG